MASGAAAAVERSLALVAERGDPAPAIYARLFADYPDAEARFIRDTSGAIRAEMLAMAFQCLMDPEGPYQANLVAAERVNHDGFGTPPQDFDRFFWIVLDVCRAMLGEAWTEAFEAAWRTQIARLGVPE